MTSAQTILVVEDDSHIAARVVRGLKKEGFAVELATDGEQARERMSKGEYALVVLDLMLPGIDGFGLLQLWRDRSSTPVIVLTASDSLQSRLRSFDLGAVDWMPKPFFMEELLARIGTRLRLSKDGPRQEVSWADVVVDLDARTVQVGGTEQKLTAHELNLLGALLTRPGRALSRRQLMELALPEGEADERSERGVDTHIGRVRKKLGEGGRAIATVWGVGYRFDAKSE